MGTGINEELVRRMTELFNDGGIDRALEVASEDFVMDWSNSIGPLKGVYRGREAVIGLWRSFTDAWDEVRWDAEEVFEASPTQVIVVNHVHMRGKGSGVEVDATGVQLWTVVDGEARSIKLYQSKPEALAAVGD